MRQPMIINEQNEEVKLEHVMRLYAVIKGIDTQYNTIQYSISRIAIERLDTNIYLLTACSCLLIYNYIYKNLYKKKFFLNF